MKFQFQGPRALDLEVLCGSAFFFTAGTKKKRKPVMEELVEVTRFWSAMHLHDRSKRKLYQISVLGQTFV